MNILPDDVPDLSDFQDDDSFGEWLHAQLQPKYLLESESWAKDIVAAAERRLLAKRFPENHFHVEIAWIDEPTAFTAPGRYIYICRDLLQRLQSEDAVAMVIAHEFAHHELGHMATFVKGRIWRNVPQGDMLRMLLYVLRKFATSPENERDADLYGLDLCLRAGYEGGKCLALFDILEAILLDYNATQQIYGPRDPFDARQEGTPGWTARAEVWAWERSQGYPALHTRREMLETFLTGRNIATTSLRLPGQSGVRRPTPARNTLLARLAAIDRALETWNSQMTSAAANLVTLTQLPTYRKIVGDRADNADKQNASLLPSFSSTPDSQPAANARAPLQPSLQLSLQLSRQLSLQLSGSTQKRVESSLAKIPEISENLHRLFDMLNRAEKLRATVSPQMPTEQAICDLEELLLGKSILVASRSVALEHRSLLASTTHDTYTTPAETLSQMATSYEGARDLVFEIDAIWTTWRPLLADLGQQILALDERANTLGLAAAETDRHARLRQTWTDLRRFLDSDPLALHDAIRVQLQTEIDQQRSHLQALTQQRINLMERLLQARAKLDQTPTLNQETRSDLSAWLDTLQTHIDQGRYQAVSVGLERWMRSLIGTPI